MIKIMLNLIKLLIELKINYFNNNILKLIMDKF